ncbi:hypothetical protein LTR37_017354 [Vermiconidia calcicola]|uniref:Uncharacterized protein n=1 Tax=Vermiconidia calcicola TaxID=1690605 RepID=A0ACC3MK76_9PEZI|nr:hypothetical protein LTR37_017354 [Vermiconidia calcicola]
MSDATTNTLGLPTRGLPIGKMLPVTGSFAIPLVVTASLLSLNVVKTRIDNNTFQGEKSISKDGKEAAGVKQPDGNTYDPLLIATRVHGNMMENMPITLVLAALAELNGADRKKLTTILAAFCVIRIAHVVGLTRANQLARAAGYFGTQFVQLGLVGWLGLLTKGYWGY